MSQARVHLTAAAAFLVLAVAFSWPLPAHVGTHLLGNPNGDTGVYVWNPWVFRHELLEHGHSPLATDALFAPSDRPARLFLHNYTILADVVALPFQKAFGGVKTFNVVYMFLAAANAYGFFLLARYLTGHAPAAFVAAIAFGFCPFLVARGTAHFSLATAVAIPVFLLLLLKARDTGRQRYAIGAGLAMVAAALSDAYYGVFCAIAGAFVILDSAIVVSAAAEPVSSRRARWRRVLEASMAALLLLSLWISWTGGGALTIGGRRLVQAKSLHTPVLLLTVLLVARLLSTRTFRWRREADWRWGAKLLAAGGAALFVAALPLIVTLAGTVAEGRYVQPDVHWRSSPPGVDLLALVLPNPNHPWYRSGAAWLQSLPNGFVENVASQSLVALVVIAAAAALRPEALPRFWWLFTAFFTLLALGPFVRIAGLNTLVPTPWALFRYVPLMANARSPTRFAVLVTLGVAVLFAFALRELAGRKRAGLALTAGVAAALIFELSPVPRTLYPADIPAVYTQIAADPREVAVLELPLGIRSGADNVGDFTAFSMFCQTVHGKRLFGGYLSRVPFEQTEVYRKDPILDALLTLSSGQSLSPEAAEAARLHRREFLRESGLGYVVIDTRRASEKLQRFAVNTLRLEEIGADGPFDLYTPTGQLPVIEGLDGR